jgi:hypothetical protein
MIPENGSERKRIIADKDDQLCELQLRGPFNVSGAEAEA